MTRWLKILFEAAYRLCSEKAIAIIRKDGPSETPYCIYSEKGKNLGCYSSEKKAKDRLKQIEMWKHMKEEQ